MTPLPTFSRSEDLRFSIDAAIAAHGPRRVLFAVLRALFRPPPQPKRRYDERSLTTHLRRDIGLPPIPRNPSEWTPADVERFERALTGPALSLTYASTPRAFRDPKR